MGCVSYNFVYRQDQRAIETDCKIVGDGSIFGRCVDNLEWGKFRESCKYDMCATGDGRDDEKTPVCLMMAALAHECSLIGFEVDWLYHCPVISSMCEGTYRSF